MSAKVSRGAAVLQQRWWFSMFTRTWHSGQTHFPRYQSAHALAGFRRRLWVTVLSHLRGKHLSDVSRMQARASAHMD